MLHIRDKSLPNLKHCNSYSKFKPFPQKSSKNKQRLIPLTREINKVMMYFNALHSSPNVTEKPINNTLSITSLVRGEVQNILEELSISDQFIRKENIYDLIEHCLKDKVTVIHEIDGRATNFKDDIDLNQEFEVTAEEILDDKEELIVENMQILEQRIIHLEERISCMLKNIPKLRTIQAKRFKLNTNALIEEMRKIMYNKESESSNELVQHTENKSISTQNQEETSSDENKLFNKYDDMYYARREYTLNLLNYKKSLESLELNQKSKFNPCVKSLSIALPKSKYHFKQKSAFLATNDE